jgi:hypothetical protein
MKNLNQHLATIVLAMMAAGIAQAGDMDGAVAYSLGEFDRVGVSQPLPKAQAGKHVMSKKDAAAGQSAQERALAARKAEFVRRMFWVALSVR